VQGKVALVGLGLLDKPVPVAASPRCFQTSKPRQEAGGLACRGSVGCGHRYVSRPQVLNTKHDSSSCQR
jgi:hypothetical protein